MRLSCRDLEKIFGLEDIEQAPDLRGCLEHLDLCRGCHHQYSEVALLLGVAERPSGVDIGRKLEAASKQGATRWRWRWRWVGAAAACAIAFIGVGVWSSSDNDSHAERQAEVGQEAQQLPSQSFPLRIETTEVIPNVSGDRTEAQVVKTRFVFEHWQPQPSKWLKEKP